MHVSRPGLSKKYSDDIYLSVYGFIKAKKRNLKKRHSYIILILWESFVSHKVPRYLSVKQFEIWYVCYLILFVSYIFHYLMS